MAEAFCRLRLTERGAAYGAFDAAVDVHGIIERAVPGV
jgi:putative acyl-CoA dehydrogenase